MAEGRRAGPVIVGAAVVGAVTLRTLTAGSFWMHLASGRFILDHGLPRNDPFSWWLQRGDPAWVNPTWLADAALAFLGSRAGVPAVLALLALATAAGFFLAAQAARSRTSRLDRLLALVLAAWVLSPGYLPGPFALAAPVTGGMLLLCRTGMRRLDPIPIAGAVLLQVLWTNLHPSFVLGPVIAGLAWRRGGAPWRGPAIGAGLGLATLLNPYGVRLHADLLNRALSIQRQVTLEWISPFHEEFLPDPARMTATVFLVLLVLPFILSRRRLLPAALVPAVVSALLLVRFYHLSPEAALLGTPMVAVGLGLLRRTGLRRVSFPRPWATGSAIAVGTMVVVFTLADVVSDRHYRRMGHPASFGIGIESAMFPSAACLERMAMLPATTVLGNLAHDGGFLAWHLPDRRVFTDTRGHLYGQRFYADVYEGLGGEEDGWAAINARGRLTAILLPASWLGSGRVIHLLLLTELWELVFFDGTSALLVRRTSEHEGLFADTGSDGSEAIRAALAQAEARGRSGWRQPRFPVRLTGAARIYQSGGEYERSRRIYPLLIRDLPRMAGAWYDLGVACVKTGNPKAAAVLLNRYVRAYPEFVLGWLWLGRAEEQRGKTEAAEAAFARAAAFNRNLTRAFREGREVTDPGTLPPELMQPAR